MIEEKLFSKVCTETLEILSYVSDEEYYKVPKEFIEMLNENCDNQYDFEIDETKDFENQNLLPETYDMLAYIYRKYWCSEIEKQEFKEKIYKNQNIKDEVKMDIDEHNKMVKYEKENFINKIIKLIKKFFKKIK